MKEQIEIDKRIAKRAKPIMRKEKKTDEAVSEQAGVESGLLAFTDRHHLNFCTSSFPVLKPSLVALQKNEEMEGVGRTLASGCTSSSGAPVWSSHALFTPTRTVTLMVTMLSDIPPIEPDQDLNYLLLQVI